MKGHPMHTVQPGDLLRSTVNGRRFVSMGTYLPEHADLVNPLPPDRPAGCPPEYYPAVFVQKRSFAAPEVNARRGLRDGEVYWLRRRYADGGWADVWGSDHRIAADLFEVVR